MSTTLQQTINWAQTFVQYTPLTAGVGNELALSLANEVVSTITSAPFTWPWNRAEYTSLVLERGVQDYIVPVSYFGFLEKATLITADGKYSYEIKDVYNSYMLGVSVSDFAEPKAVSVLNGSNGAGGFISSSGVNFGSTTSSDSATIVAGSCLSISDTGISAANYQYQTSTSASSLISGQAVQISGTDQFGGIFNTTGFVKTIFETDIVTLTSAPNGLPAPYVVQQATSAAASGSSSLVLSFTQPIAQSDVLFLVVYVDYDTTYGAPTITAASGNSIGTYTTQISGLQYAQIRDIVYLASHSSDAITVSLPHTGAISATGIILRQAYIENNVSTTHFALGASSGTAYTNWISNYVFGFGVGAGSGTIGASDGKTLLEGNNLTCITYATASGDSTAVSAAFSGNTSQFMSGVVSLPPLLGWGLSSDVGMICPTAAVTAPSVNFSASANICADNHTSPLTMSFGNSNPGTSSTSPIQTGQLMVVTFWCSAIGGYIPLNSISDSNANDWIQLISPYQYIDSTGEYNTVQVFYALSNTTIPAGSVHGYTLTLSVTDTGGAVYGFESTATTYNYLGAPVGSPTTAYVADGTFSLPMSLTTSQTAAILMFTGGGEVNSLTGNFQSVNQSVEGSGSNTLGASGAWFWYNPSPLAISAPAGTYSSVATLNPYFGTHGGVGIMSAFSIL